MPEETEIYLTPDFVVWSWPETKISPYVERKLDESFSGQRNDKLEIRGLQNTINNGIRSAGEVRGIDLT